MGTRSLARVTALVVALGGCTTLAVPAGTPEDRLPGRMLVEPGRPGLVVAAPHGTSDIGTGEMAIAISRRTGAGLVVAQGFTIETGTGEQRGWRYQVNRPREGLPGAPAGADAATPIARRVYQAYEDRVRAAARGPLRLYVELHGNDRTESAGRIEVATVGIDGDRAVRVRTLFELVRDARLGRKTTAPRLAIRVEGADSLRYTASSAKQDGILRLPERALHLELPREARTQWRAVYAEILADFVDQVSLLLFAS